MFLQNFERVISPEEVVIMYQYQNFRGWAPAGPLLPGCPPGLEYLTRVDQLLVHQRTEFFELATGIETENKYEVKNSLGQVIYFAVEDSNLCTGNCLGSERSVFVRILDSSRREVIHLEKPFSCVRPGCCLQEVTVLSPPGSVIGSIKQQSDLCKTNLDICNEYGQCVLKIDGPCLTCNLCSNVEFPVLALNGQVIGKISTQWPGSIKELFAYDDLFGIQFPIDLPYLFDYNAQNFELIFRQKSMLRVIHEV